MEKEKGNNEGKMEKLNDNDLKNVMGGLVEKTLEQVNNEQKKELRDNQ